MTISTLAIVNALLVLLTVAALAAVTRLGLRLHLPAEATSPDLHLGELADAA